MSSYRLSRDADSGRWRIVEDIAPNGFYPYWARRAHGSYRYYWMARLWLRWLRWRQRQRGTE